MKNTFSRIRHMNFRSAAELKIKKKHTCFRGTSCDFEIIAFYHYVTCS